MQPEPLPRWEAADDGEWLLTPTRVLLWNVAGVPIMAAGMAIFLGVAWLMGGGKMPHTLNPNWTIAGLGAFAPLLGLHEWVHGLLFRRYGGRPRYGFKVVYGMPMFYATAPGHWLSKRQYAAVSLGPTIFLSLGGIALMALAPPLRVGLALSLAIHLGCCVGDWDIARAIWRLPPDALCQDRETGFGYRLARSGGRENRR